MLCFLCSEGGMSRSGRRTTRVLHLSQVIADFDAIFAVNFGKFDYHVESSTFLCIATALRLEIIRKECSNSKRA